MSAARAAVGWRSWCWLAFLVVCGYFCALVAGYLLVGLVGFGDTKSTAPDAPDEIPVWYMVASTVLPLAGVGAGVALWFRGRRERAAESAEGTAAATDCADFVAPALTAGLIGGGIGFGAVLVWSGIVGANQGPLLGIFVTGPVGFVVGCVVGAIRHRSKSRR